MKKYPEYKDSGIEWIKEIPESWSVKQVKHCSINHDEKRIPLSSEERGNRQGAFPYYGATGIIDYVDDYLFEGNYLLVGEDGAPFFIDNEDVAFIASGKFWVNNHAHVLQSNGECDLRYLMYALNSVNYKEYITGSTRDKLTQSELSRIRIPFPPLRKQKQIADFIDHKTKQIDTKIEKKQKLIELLKEQRIGIINQAVTKGLDLNVHMKDSGIEWLGEIPQHWDLIPLKFIAYMKGRIGWQGLKQSEFTDEGPYLITGMNFKDGKMDWDNCYHITDERYQEGPEIHVDKGDVLITKDGTIGKLLYMDNPPEKVSLNSHLLLIRPLDEEFLSKFLYYCLQSNYFLGHIDTHKTGTTFFGITQEAMGIFKMLIPTIQEQDRIIQFIEGRLGEIDTIIVDQNKSIELLKEYRTALISEVVTGKIDLREEDSA